LKLDKERIEKLRVEGKFNILLVSGVILTIFFQTPSPFREFILITLAIISYFTTSKSIHNYNNFNFYPIKEVAILFAGIFITMVPALLLLHTKGKELGITSPFQFFWLTGVLSSFLDNAPTYLTFFSLGESVSEGICSCLKIAGVSENILKAISCGAVFMGANTYIGNGPNFMVKSITEHYGVKMPSFLGYMKYSVLILIPIFIIITLVFFR
jgi:Na+/H+ antiporter NhaD/arsenite permease-like protein